MCSIHLQRISIWTVQIWKGYHTVAQLVGCPPAKWKFAGSIPAQGTFLGCRFGPGWGMYKRQLINDSLSHQCFSPSLSLSFPFPLKINKILKTVKKLNGYIILNSTDLGLGHKLSNVAAHWNHLRNLKKKLMPKSWSHDSCAFALGCHLGIGFFF